MKLILASNNKNKVAEFAKILEGTGIEVVPQSEAGCHFEVDETGETFEENAFLKAEAAMRATGIAGRERRLGAGGGRPGRGPGSAQRALHGQSPGHGRRPQGAFDEKSAGSGTSDRPLRLSHMLRVPQRRRAERARHREGSIATYMAGEKRLWLRRHVHPRGREPHHGRDDARGKKPYLTPQAARCASLHGY